MKFTCTQENLSQGLALVSRSASKNIALPILNNVLIIAEDNQIRLQTTNLELGVTTIIRGKIETPGRYTVQSRLLSDFIGLLGNEKVTCETGATGLVVTSGHSKTTIKGLPADDFPVLPTVEGGIKTTVPAKEISRCLEGVAFAVANDDARPEISGIYFFISGATITAAATDSYRLAERKTRALETSPTEHSFILPARSAQELLRIISTSDEGVVISANDTQALFRVGDVELVSRLIDGKYPDYQQIIPHDHQTRVTCQRELLINNIRAASLFCKSGINDLYIQIEPEKKQIILRAANTQLGEHEATIEAAIEGQAGDIVFNYRYLLEGLQSIGGDEVYLDLTDSQAPGVIRSAANQELLYLLMPIRQ